MIHPFAHMNSNFAARYPERLTTTPEERRTEFANFLSQLKSTPEATAAEPAAMPMKSAAAFGTAGSMIAPADEVASEPVTPSPEEPETVEPSSPETAGDTTVEGDVEEPEVVISPNSPNIPRYKEVPESSQWPNGPYKQAPAELGGEWWYVSPFTGSEPWLTQGLPVAEAPEPQAPEWLTEDAIRVFGERPERSEGMTSAEHRSAVQRWEQDCQYLQQTGVPDGYSEAQVEAAQTVYDAWGMGKAEYYEGRYGWRVRFPEGAVPGFEMAVSTAIDTPHLVAAKYQVRMADHGLTVTERHPFVPPQWLEPRNV